MLAIKDMEMPEDCKKCPLMGTDGNPKDLLSPMMCIPIWATKHEIKHCIQGKIRDDCPLIEIEQSEDCVSRQALLKIFNDKFNKHFNLHSESKVLGVINSCIKTVEMLSPVTPAQLIATVKFDKDELREICKERIEIECQHGTCNDCKHCLTTETFGLVCGEHKMMKLADDFYCADFERRE